MALQLRNTEPEVYDGPDIGPAVEFQEIKFYFNTESYCFL